MGEEQDIRPWVAVGDIRPDFPEEVSEKIREARAREASQGEQNQKGKGTVEMKRCKTCRWWSGIRDGESFFNKGDCRISAPMLVQWGSLSDGIEVNTRWPRTEETDWCGSWDADAEIAPTTLLESGEDNCVVPLRGKSGEAP